MERTKCEIWSRVMGYLRPTDCWNVGKQQEFKERTCFEEDLSSDRSLEYKDDKTGAIQKDNISI